MNTVKTLIIDRLRATGRAHIEDVISYMEKNGFFTNHCNSHHRYIGGLADHAWQTYLCAKRQEEKECRDNPRHKALDDDSLAICCVLHDMYACYGYRDIRGHGLRSAVILVDLGLDLSREEYLAVRYHMGLRKHLKEPLYAEANRSQLRYRVHKADRASAAS